MNIFKRKKRGFIGLGFIPVEPLPRFRSKDKQEYGTKAAKPQEQKCPTCLPAEELPKALKELGFDNITRAKLVGLKLMLEQGTISEKELEKEMTKIGQHLRTKEERRSESG